MRKVKTITKAIVGLMIASMPFSAEARQWSLKDCIDYARPTTSHCRKHVCRHRVPTKTICSRRQPCCHRSALLPTRMSTTRHGWPTASLVTDTQGFHRQGVLQRHVQRDGQLHPLRRRQATGAGEAQQTGGRGCTTRFCYTGCQTAGADSPALRPDTLLHRGHQREPESYQSSLENENRGKEMVKIGKMSKADLAQLTAQRAQDEYNIVEAKNNVRNYKRQLKELLQITDEEAFDVVMPNTTEAMALAEIPALQSVYTAALDRRPEMKVYQNQLAQNDSDVKIAKAGKLPTIGLNAGLSTSTTSMNTNSWGSQIKNNFNVGGGFSVSIPLFDNRQTKTAVNKACIQQQQILLDMKNEQTQLYSTIENYWLQANTNQSQYQAAKVSRESTGKLQPAERAVPLRTEEHRGTSHGQGQPVACPAERVAGKIPRYPQPRHAEVLSARKNLVKVKSKKHSI